MRKLGFLHAHKISNICLNNNHRSLIKSTSTRPFMQFFMGNLMEIVAIIIYIAMYVYRNYSSYIIIIASCNLRLLCSYGLCFCRKCSVCRTIWNGLLSRNSSAVLFHTNTSKYIATCACVYITV